MKTLLCFGDSNTWGAAPMADLADSRRFGPQQRWPGVLRQRLGPEWQVIEEGLPGRTIGRDDPVEGADRNARRYLQPCLHSHRPLDWVALMLGTNDLKARFGASPQDIAVGLHTLIDLIRLSDLPQMPAPRILVICPTPVVEVGCLAGMFHGGAATAVQLAPLYREIARLRGAEFLDAGEHIRVSASDGIHLDLDAHLALGDAVAVKLMGLV